MNFDFDDDLFRNRKITKKYRIDKTNIRLMNFYEYKNSILSKKTLDIFNKKYNSKKWNMDFTFVLITTHSRDIQHAMNHAELILSRFISIINLSLYYGRSRLSFFSQLYKPITSIRVSPYIFVFKSRYKYETLFYSDIADYKEFKRITAAEYDRFMDVYKTIKSIDTHNDIYPIIQRALELYQLGITEREKSSAFLKFWSSLELMTFKTKNDSYTWMMERVKSIMVTNQIIDFRLDDLKKKRNVLAHEQIDFIYQKDINLIRNMSEVMLSFLITNTKKYNKLDVEFIYDNGGKSTKIMKREKRILRDIIKSRNLKP